MSSLTDKDTSRTARHFVEDSCQIYSSAQSNSPHLTTPILFSYTKSFPDSISPALYTSYPNLIMGERTSVLVTNIAYRLQMRSWGLRSRTDSHAEYLKTVGSHSDQIYLISFYLEQKVCLIAWHCEVHFKNVCTEYQRIFP